MGHQMGISFGKEALAEKVANVPEDNEYKVAACCQYIDSSAERTHLRYVVSRM